MNEILISYIIPAYNAAAYLEDCLQSLPDVNSAIHKAGMEVIVVDDGSSDATGEIAEAYAERRPWVSVVHQPNGGLSVARNVGVERAQGKYICFVDADDQLTDSDPYKLLQTLTCFSPDIVGINVLLVSEGKLKPYRRYVPPYNKLYTPARGFMKGRNLMPCACAYLFRREFLESHQLRFAPYLLHEDEEFTPRAFALAESFMALDLDYYLRFIHPGSITTNSDLEHRKRKLRHMVQILQQLDEWARHDEDIHACMQCKLDFLAVDTLRLLFRQRMPKEFCREITGKLCACGYFPLKRHWGWKYYFFKVFSKACFGHHRP